MGKVLKKDESVFKPSLILIDGMVLAYQCNYGAGFLKSSKGVYTGMVFGCLGIVWG